MDGTHIDDLIIEIEEDFKSYKSAGLIDKSSLYRWGLLKLNKFGQSILSKNEKFIEIVDGVGILPDNFQSLHYAIKCSPKGYHCKKESEPVLQNSIFWRERTERGLEWNSCDPCCSTETEKIIEEKVYIDNVEVNFYHKPMPLRLVNHMNRDVCSSDCRNLRMDCEHEISINNKRIHANFKEGTVLITYYGLQTDEKGLYYIPDSPRGDILTYIETHLKKRILENIVMNGDDKNAKQLLSFYVQKEREEIGPAQASARYMTLKPSSYAKIARLNREDYKKYEILLPTGI